MNSTYNIFSITPITTHGPLSKALGMPVSVARDLPNQSEEANPRERLLFHLGEGDYFALINTVLGFCEEEAMKTGAATEPLLRGIRLIRQDLGYLDRHYTIVPKDRK